MIKYLTMSLAFTGNNNQKKYTAMKKGSHINYIYSNNCISNGPPEIIDTVQEEKIDNFIKNKWMQDRLFQLQSARLSIIDKEEIAKEVLDLIDLDDIAKIGFNLMAGGLTGDWDNTYFDK